MMAVLLLFLISGSGLDKEGSDHKDQLKIVIESAFQNIKNLRDFKKVLVVLGNETCDLDSAISSLIYSLVLHLKKSADSIVIPVFNIPRSHLPIKTEVTHVLKKVGINLDHIICRDQIDLKSLQESGSLELTLVDHHAMSEADKGLAKSVVAVLDHRPQDPVWLWGGVDLTLRPVGSCSTLVADKLLSLAPQLVTPAIAVMLLGPILLDTANLSQEVGRSTPLDHQIIDKLKTLVPFGEQSDCTQLFQELSKAKSDVSTLTTSQLLIKDVKVAGGIPIAGLPIKVDDFLKRADAFDALQELCKENNAPVSVIYGSRVDSGVVTRDVAVFSLSDNEASTKVVIALTSSTDPLLQLEPKPCSVQGVTLFEAKNIKATRKQFLPLIRKVGETLSSTR